MQMMQMKKLKDGLGALKEMEPAYSEAPKAT